MKVATIVLVAVACPDCGFNLNYVTSRKEPPYNSDALAGVLAASCESCGATFAVDPGAVNDAQHECLRLLGEADDDATPLVEPPAHALFYSAPCGCEYQETADATDNDPCREHTLATNAAKAIRADVLATLTGARS